MVDFQLDIYNKLHPDGEEPKGIRLFAIKIIILKLFIVELIEKREEIVTRFTELSQAVQPLLDAVVTEDAARLIEHQRYISLFSSSPSPSSLLETVIQY